MKDIAKRILLLSGKSFSFLAFVVSCLTVAAALLWQHQINASEAELQQKRQYQHALNTLNNSTSSQVMLLRKQLTSVAQRPVLSAILGDGNTELITKQQQVLLKVFPSAKSICLIGSEVDNVDNNACIPITYATLDSLRQAKKEGSSSIGIMQATTDAAHLLLAQRIVDQDNNVVGVLVITFAPDVVTNQLFTDQSLDGYAELQQGSTNAIVLASQGKATLKQGAASFRLDLAGTHWHIAYWPEKASVSTPPLTLIIIVLAVMILMWLLREAIRSYIHKTDVATLSQQLVDLTNGEMKIKYTIIDSALGEISTNIRTLSKTLTAVTSSNSLNREVTNTETTSAIVSEKLAENKTDNPAELEVREDIVDMDKNIFKAYDIRGIVGESLNAQVVGVIGRAIGSQVKELGMNNIVVGRDGRHSSPEFSEALITGILASGCDVSDIGMVPTPVLYFASHNLEILSSVMVTGSHNPANYNGLKIVLGGKSLASDDLQGLYQYAAQGDFVKGKGNRHEVDVMEAYLQKITEDIKLSRSIKVVLDCGNGVTGNFAPILFRALGCDVIELYSEVDGNFPNHEPDPSQPDNLQDLIKAVQEHDAELGIAFDGDGDRLGVVDAMGNIIFPDRLMVMFAQDILLRKPGSVIIHDVKSTNLLGEEISRAGGEAIMWQSGHSVIKNKMIEMNAQLAGELSGHIFFKERWYGFDDGMYAAARLFELLCQDPLARTPTEIFATLPNRKTTPEILLAMNAGESRRFIAQIQQEGDFSGAQVTTIDGLRADYVNGWGLVRASNTMPGLTLRFEGDTEDDLYQIQEKFKRQMLQIKPTLTVLFSGAVSLVSSSESSGSSRTLPIGESTSSSLDEPMTFSLDEPVSLDEPMSLDEHSPRDEPTSSNLDEPMTFSLDEPVSLDENSPLDEPMSLSLGEPIPLSLEEPSSPAQEESSSLTLEDKPALTLEDTK